MSKGGHPWWSKSMGLFLLRLALAAVFIYHGYGKLANIPQTEAFFNMLGIPAANAISYAIGVIELVGGVLLLLGVATCITASVLAVDMIAALLIAHTKMPYTAAELPIALLGGLFALAGAGGGKWSLWHAKCCNERGGRSCGGHCGSDEKEKEGCGCGGSCGCGNGEMKK